MPLDNSVWSLRPFTLRIVPRLIFTHHTWQSIKRTNNLQVCVCWRRSSTVSLEARQPQCFGEWVLLYTERQNIPADFRHSQCLQACIYTRKPKSRCCRAGWEEQAILEEPSTKQSEHSQSPQVSLEFQNCPGLLLCEIMTLSTHTCYN